MTVFDFRTTLRAGGTDAWLGLLGLGIALSPSHTKIAGATWLLLCLAGVAVLFRTPDPDASGRLHPASKAWVIACAIAAALASGVALYWPDRPDTLHAEFRLLLAAVATHLLVRRLPCPAAWRAYTLPAIALACAAALLKVGTTPDRLYLPSNAIPWAVALAMLLCILLPQVLEAELPAAHRKWYAMAIVTGLIAVLLSQSRAAYGILLWTAWLLATRLQKTQPRIHLRNAAVTGLLASALLATSAWLPGDPLRLRLGWNELVTAQQEGNYATSMGARVYIWSLAWQSVQESPWIGIGGRERSRRLKEAGAELPGPQREQLAVVRKLGHVHNQYLHAAMDGGVFGLASTLAVLAGLGAAALRLRQTDPVASRQMQGVLFMHATAGLTNVNMAHNYYAVMLSLSVALILAGARVETPSRPD